MPATYCCEEDCKSKLGKQMQRFRAERPSEWLMDEFIRGADAMQEKIDKLHNAMEEISSMKIPYCDADDVAHTMRDIARDAISDK